MNKLRYENKQLYYLPLGHISNKLEKRRAQRYAAMVFRPSVCSVSFSGFMPPTKNSRRLRAPKLPVMEPSYFVEKEDVEAWITVHRWQVASALVKMTVFRGSPNFSKTRDLGDVGSSEPGMHTWLSLGPIGHTCPNSTLTARILKIRKGVCSPFSQIFRGHHLISPRDICHFPVVSLPSLPVVWTPLFPSHVYCPYRVCRARGPAPASRFAFA